MSQDFEIIRARTKDDAVVLINRLMRSSQQELVLVLPKNSIIAADLNSLKILKEEAESVGKTLSLCTENGEINSFARKLGMAIYYANDQKKSEYRKSEKKIKKTKIMTDITPPFAKYVPKEEIDSEIPKFPAEPPIPMMPAEPDQSELGPAERCGEGPVIYEAASKNQDLEKNIENFYGNDFNIGKIEKFENKYRRFSIKHLTAVLSVVGLLFFAAAMYLILPKADIKISLKQIPIKTQVLVAASKIVSSPNLVGGIIPGQYFLLSKDGSKTIEGSAQIGGAIKIYNAYSTVSQKLIAQTRFETKDGKIFRIQNTVVVPGAKMSGSKLAPSFIKVNVIGDGVSDDYLIGPSYFTIPGFKDTPKYAGFYAESAEPMATVKTAFISKSELDKSKSDLEDQLAKELKSEILSNLKDADLRLIDGASSVKIDDYKINGNVLSMKITWQALFFKESDLRTLIDYFVSSHYPDLQDFAFKDTISYPPVSNVDFKKGEIFFTLNINKNNALSADTDALKKEIVGRDENDIRSIISGKPYINSASISLWPFWVKKAPNSFDKINITVDSNL